MFKKGEEFNLACSSDYYEVDLDGKYEEINFGFYKMIDKHPINTSTPIKEEAGYVRNIQDISSLNSSSSTLKKRHLTKTDPQFMKDVGVQVGNSEKIGSTEIDNYVHEREKPEPTKTVDDKSPPSNLKLEKDQIFKIELEEPNFFT